MVVGHYTEPLNRVVSVRKSLSRRISEGIFTSGTPKLITVPDI